MRYRPLLFILFTVCISWIPAHAQPVMPGGDVLAKVGDQQITRDMLNNIIATIPEENRARFLTPDGKERLLDEVISFFLFAEAAHQEGIDKEPAVKTRLDYVQKEYLHMEYLRRQLAKMPPISEDELMAYYKGHIDEFKPPEEIKARHILVPTEAQAKKILDESQAGKDFGELAKKNSIDPAGARGGLLESPTGSEWVPLGTFEKSFEVTLFKIPKGQVGGPHKTQFGWHILRVDDRRQPETPAFVQVRGRILNQLQEQRNMQARAKLIEDLKKRIPVTTTK